MILDRFREITRESLAFFSTGSGRRLSILTRYGVPFELSVSLSSKGNGGLRYVTEAGDLRCAFQDRLLQSNEVSKLILECIGAIDRQELNQTLFDVIFPDYIQVLQNYRFGLWHGMVHRSGRSDVLKIYYNIQPWRQKIPTVLNRAFSALAPFIETHRLNDMMSSLPRSAPPWALCVEYSAIEPVKVKLYYRCVETVQKQIFDDLLNEFAMEHHCKKLDILHQHIVGHNLEYPERSLTLYVGWDSLRKAPLLNLYLALNRFLHGDFSAKVKISNVLSEFDFNNDIYERTLQAVASEGLPKRILLYHTMIGIGFTHQDMRITIYLQPNWRELGMNARAENEVIL